MTNTNPVLHSQNNSGTTNNSLSSQLPPIEEVCRILARVLTRVQVDPQPGSASAVEEKLQ